ncbi:hypothetical protein AJ79_04895 [Helicocarpus griseus UAMH5409]|uniref:Magnesium transporter n=1 Tax=Helicocarpus griseus UAMH5409 TaxID=1447875 RepID=A0A2B7XI43_9EURO|nr:hypothetical protein AJ79_04895 [Helicocarpus griseus UAMH5409]
MVSPSTLPLKPCSTTSTAPSANLLRFLRSQSESLLQPPPARAHASARSANLRIRPCPWRFQGQPLQRTPHSSWITGNSKNGINATTLEPPLLSPPSPFFHAQAQKTQRHTPLLIPTRPSAPRIPPKPLPKHQLRCFSGTPARRARGAGRSFIRRMLGLKVPEHERGLRSNDLPAGPILEDGHEGNMFSSGRSLALKATNEPRLRCTELDGNGDVTLVNGEFRKSELIAKYGLLPRDLRKIDSSVLPHILVRHSAILISLLHLRVLIKADRVLVFDAYGSADSYTQSVFMYDLEGKLRQKELASRQSTPGALPYEFRALEAVLVSVTGGLEAEFEGVREPVVRVLRALEEDIDRDKLRHLLIYSKRLGTFEQKARLVRDAIEDLLEADDDLTAMYLTEKAKGVHRQEHDHQEVEMLLESYHKVCDEIVQASGNLVTNIRNTEEIVKAILDANRNSLMLLDLKFSIGTLGLAAGTLCSALYGMNLKNFIEESDFGFLGVSGACFVFTAFVCAYGLMKLRKVQRVRMWGEAGLHDRSIGALGALRTGAGPKGQALGVGGHHRTNWRADSVDPLWTGLAGESRNERLKRLRHHGGTGGAAVGVGVLSSGANAVGGEQMKRAKGGKQQQRPVENDVVDANSAESAESAAASSGSR